MSPGHPPVSFGAARVDSIVLTVIARSSFRLHFSQRRLHFLLFYSASLRVCRAFTGRIRRPENDDVVNVEHMSAHCANARREWVGGDLH